MKKTVKMPKKKTTLSSALQAAKPKTFGGKSMKLGGGGKFKKMATALRAKRISASEANAITAKARIKAHGKSVMLGLAAAGRKRAAKAGG